MSILIVEIKDLIHWVFVDFLGAGFQFLDKIAFYLNGVRFSMLDLVLASIALALIVFLLKFLFGIEFRIGLHDYVTGRPHINASETLKRVTDKNGNVVSEYKTQSVTKSQRQVYKGGGK